MSSEPFVSKPSPQPVERPLIDQPLITRYNIFIENYSKPNCIVDAIPLEAMPESSVHNIIFTVINDWKAKFVLFILLCLPILNIFLDLALIYGVVIYWLRLGLHERNMAKVPDPFKNMVFDPELCFKLHKDFYAFTIEFKELEGFSLNYNKDMRKELSLREERGKANFMIYNTNFWASFHHFGKWKREHVSLLLSTVGITAIINIILFVFIL